MSEDEVVVTLDQVRSLVQNESLTPEQVFGKDYMTSWRRDADNIDRIYHDLDDRDQANAEPDEPKEGDLPRHADPKFNPMIRLDPDA